MCKMVCLCAYRNAFLCATLLWLICGLLQCAMAFTVDKDERIVQSLIMQSIQTQCENESTVNNPVSAVCYHHLGNYPPSFMYSPMYLPKDRCNYDIPSSSNSSNCSSSYSNSSNDSNANAVVCNDTLSILHYTSTLNNSNTNTNTIQGSNNHVHSHGYSRTFVPATPIRIPVPTRVMQSHIYNTMNPSLITIPSFIPSSTSNSSVINSSNTNTMINYSMITNDSKRYTDAGTSSNTNTNTNSDQLPLLLRSYVITANNDSSDSNNNTTTV